MHVIFRERHGLDGLDSPVDLAQSPGEIVVLSFSDSDLGAFAEAWRAQSDALPSLRLANLAALKHPLSVDAYCEKTLAHAKAILVRLIGGEAYWSYGLRQVQDLALSAGAVLAVLPADGRRDERLEAYSTLPADELHELNRLCDIGGAEAAGAALGVLARAAGLPAPPARKIAPSPAFGWHENDDDRDAPLAIVVFYRSYVTAADLAPIRALRQALRERGFRTFGLYAASLKDPEAAVWIAAEMTRLAPAIIVNATAFSGRGADGRSPLDCADRPVLQVALSTARREEWRAAERGLSPGDLAMHVVLPEVDGRIFAGVVSFKAQQAHDADLDFSRSAHGADPERVAAVADKARALVALAQTPASQRRVAFVLSTYPGKPHMMAHAVGLDVLQSCAVMMEMLRGEGYAVGAPLDPAQPPQALTRQTARWPIAAYKTALAALPQTLRDQLAAAWGAPEDDPSARDGAFCFSALTQGQFLIALQPERGDSAAREADYHDTSRVPRHAYVAFYLWLRAQGHHAMIHVGAHGTLEWLPGKSVALSGECWPEALIGASPVIYPFIVNDPGEAAQARRRIGAVTLGHLPPPLRSSGTPEALAGLARLLDEYSTADGLDPARRDRLIAAIREEAQIAGVEDDLGISARASAAEVIARIDRFVCDVKENQFGDGLHVFGRGECGQAEMRGLSRALSGRRVAPGPAGSPHRGRVDVLPTGRNLYSVDPRAVPSRAAFAQGVKLAEELLRRHLQDHGDWPRGLVVDLWGSATMRTAGEEFAMALHLAGLKPLWDAQSDRVGGFEIQPLVLLDRPRIDVTLRVSGLFRDIFPGLPQMFESACAALAARDDPADENPYRQRIARVFGPKPGTYGVNMGMTLDDYAAGRREEAGERWLAASQWAIDARGEAQERRQDLETRVRAADSFVHPQDLRETDLLLSADSAAHEAGFAAAAAHLGAQPSLYHLDATRPEAPRARKLDEEIARVVRARAANPDWINAMMRHGFRGAAEITATLDHLGAFAHLAKAVGPHLFDLYYDATLGRPDVRAFMQEANPDALSALRDRFLALKAAGLWVTRRNSIAAELGEDA